jgi:hypothetical protein
MQNNTATQKLYVMHAIEASNNDESLFLNCDSWSAWISLISVTPQKLQWSITAKYFYHSLACYFPFSKDNFSFLKSDAKWWRYKRYETSLNLNRLLRSGNNVARYSKAAPLKECTKKNDTWSNFCGPMCTSYDRLCGLVVRVPGYRSMGPGSIPGATRIFSEKYWVWNGVHSASRW